MVFSFLDFPKAHKIVVFFPVLPKVPWSWLFCVTFGYWSTCPLSYLTLWLFIVLRFSSSHPYPPMFFVIIIKRKEGGEGGGG
jgi:hypothetical protein